MMVRNRVPWLVALAVSIALTSSATAIEYTKLLPADTEAVTSINVRQILDSPLVKNTGLDQAKEALDQILQADDEIRGYVKSLGIDLFRDVHRITAAGPASKESDKGVIIVEGKFSAENFKKTAAEVSRKRGDHLKVGKIGDREMWEIVVPQQDKTFFVALADEQTLVAGLSKASLRDVLAQADGKKVDLKKEMREVIAGVDPKASLYFAAMSDALIQAVQDGLKDANVPNAGKVSDMAKDLKKKLNALSGSITIGDDLKFQVALSTKEAKVAREMAQMVTMAQGVGILALNQAAQNNEQLMPLIEVVQNIRAAPKGTMVIIRGGITAEAINKLKKGN
jgi:hypothetical protein